MKSLLKKIYNKNSVISIRNNLNIRPVEISLSKIKNNVSVSDSFCWRTDSNYETIFRFSDLLNMFCKMKDSNIKIIFYNKFGLSIKEITINNIKKNNELIINKKFLNNLEDYGTFHIYHLNDKILNEDIIISNRCYTGFSKDNNLPSFMHGNTLSSYMHLKDDKKIYSDLIKKIFLTNHIYKIQNEFSGYDKTELFFSNPTSKKVKFFINEEFYIINKNSCILMEVSCGPIITIKSNCLFLRPVIFNYNKNFIDVFHA